MLKKKTNIYISKEVQQFTTYSSLGLKILNENKDFSKKKYLFLVLALPVRSDGVRS